MLNPSRTKKITLTRLVHFIAFVDKKQIQNHIYIFTNKTSFRIKWKYLNQTFIYTKILTIFYYRKSNSIKF